MRDQRFSSPEDTVDVFKNHVLEVSQSEWKNKHICDVYQKKKCGQRFSSPEDTVEAFKNHVLEVSQSEWENTQIMVLPQSILSIGMLKSEKFSNGNVRLNLATPEICQARNTSLALVPLKLIL